ncbi:MAG: GAF domain-containing protein [Candidatus Eisenbacteria bacterium]|uniref:histidine kinase n=1 Tax=Eiseniibacteriota bacterium TaxID=2212470 RepID=A0A937X788_UNCEI|nr:GAF domain-containing protein [Candidatus Eisenbacteria bacterium]
MTLDPHSGAARPRGPAALGMSGQYSKALSADDRGLSAWLRAAAEALSGAPDADAAANAALAALAGPNGRGYRRALLLQVDPRAGRLEGRALAGAGEEELLAPLRRLRVPLAAGDEHPLVRLLSDPRAVAGVALDSTALPAPLGRLAREGALRAYALGEPGAPLGLLLLQCGEAMDEGAGEAAALLLAGQLGLLLSRARARAEAQERTAQFETVGATVRALLGSSNLPDILVLCARAALRVTRSRCALVWTLEEGEGELLLAVHQPAERRDSLEPWLIDLGKLAGACAQQNTPLRHADVRQAEETDLDGLPEAREAIFVPMRAFGDLLGVTAVLRAPAGPAGAPAFSPEEEEALSLLAGYAAVAAKNAALGDRARAAAAQEREAQEALADLRRMASVGEAAVELFDELRNPVVAIVGLARTLERELPEGDTQREYARVILREGRRIEERLNARRGQLGPARPRLTLQSLNGLLRASVDEIRDEAERHSALIEELYSEQLPDLLLDGERIRQALGNILGRALDGLQEGDTLRVETLRQSDYALVEIAHTGPRLAGEVLERLFVPFATAQPTGAGLGLATAHEIVKQHGGEISVRGAGDWAAIYTLSFPCDQSAERRRLAERRRGRERRRGA